MMSSAQDIIDLVSDHNEDADGTDEIDNMLEESTSGQMSFYNFLRTIPPPPLFLMPADIVVVNRCISGTWAQPIDLMQLAYTLMSSLLNNLARVEHHGRYVTMQTCMLPGGAVTMVFTTRNYLAMGSADSATYDSVFEHLQRITGLPLSVANTRVTNLMVRRVLPHNVHIHRLCHRTRPPADEREIARDSRFSCAPIRVVRSARTLADGRDLIEHNWALVFRSGNIVYFGFADTTELAVFDHALVRYLSSFSVPPSSTHSYGSDESRIVLHMMRRFGDLACEAYRDMRPLSINPVVGGIPSFYDWFHNQTHQPVVAQSGHELVIRNIVMHGAWSAGCEPNVIASVLENVVDHVLVRSVTYEPRRFPGIVVRMRDNVACIVFKRNIIMTGSPTLDAYRTWLDHLQNATDLPFSSAALRVSNSIATRTLAHNVDVDAVTCCTPLRSGDGLMLMGRHRYVKLRMLVSGYTSPEGREKLRHHTALVFPTAKVVYAGFTDEASLQHYDMAVTHYLHMFRAERVAAESMSTESDPVDVVMQDLEALVLSGADHED